MIMKPTELEFETNRLLSASPVIATQVCTHCKAEKPVVDFNCRNRATGALTSWCKACHNERTRSKYCRKRVAVDHNAVEKRCTRCKSVKLMDDFHYSDRTSGKRQSWCKRCLYDINRVRVAKFAPEGVTTKMCSKCGVEKSLTSFYRDRTSKWGCAPHCKVCVNERIKKRGRTTEQHRRYKLKQTYGLTVEQHKKMLLAQGNVCDLCKGPFGKKQCIDHCHTTGATRGILCNRCNIWLAGFDAHWFAPLAIDYAARHKTPLNISVRPS